MTSLSDQWTCFFLTAAGIAILFAIEMIGQYFDRKRRRQRIAARRHH